MGSIGKLNNAASVGLQYGPDENDVYDVKKYFEGTDLPVNISLKDWVEEVDRKGIPNAVSRYMDNSSINDDLRKGQSNGSVQLDNFINTSKVNAGSTLYSGITSNETLSLWDKPEGSKVRYKAYLSTSPDPVYARGYSLNTDVMLKINVTKDTSVGKTYYADSTGTEGILGRNTSFTISKKYYRKVNGKKIRIIEVSI